jgi:hypothetical protein
MLHGDAINGNSTSHITKYTLKEGTEGKVQSASHDGHFLVVKTYRG